MRLNLLFRQAVLLIVLSIASTLCFAVSNPDFLCFTAEEANAKVALKKEGNPNPVSLKYSRDCITWEDYVPGETGDVLLPNVGDKVWFRATTTNGQFNRDKSRYYFSVNGGNVAASGSVMSLLDATCQQTFVPIFAFSYLFNNCDKLTSAPELPAMQLAESCYQGMFQNCTSLRLPPELPSMKLSRSCYREMFSNCKALTNAPSVLPAKELAEFCCLRMFYGCSSLTSAPALPALQMAEMCYAEMFSNCTSLVNVPDVLPATWLWEECYSGMFDGCKSLIKAPELPATQLEDNCYEFMFANCTSLTSTPVLPAPFLDDECYRSMFLGCSALNKVIVNFSDWTDFASETQLWMAGVAKQGTFICPDNLPQIRGLCNIPNGWTIVHPDYLCFTAEEANAKVALMKRGAPNPVSLKYSKDRITWLDYVPGTTGDITLTKKGDKVWFRATSTNKTFSLSSGNRYYFSLTNKVSASGNVMSLLDATCQQTDVPKYAFNRLFSGCQKLTSAPDLPATQMGEYCYDGMFASCKSLVKAPELPATQLTESCYSSMFDGCSALTKVPVLPAMQMKENCYSGMFSGCTSLTEAPELPATKLAEDCYNSMFSGCTSLSSAPYLPAKQLALSCYSMMFTGCSSLNKVSVNFSDWDEDNCYMWMAGVAKQGIFLCPDDLPQTRGISNIPEEWSVNPYPDYLCFTAEEANAKVALKKHGKPDSVSLKYSKDRITWLDYVPGTTGDITLTKKGDKVWFRATSTNSSFSSTKWDYYLFSLTDTVAASGNVMSLLDATCQQKSVPAYAFSWLFSDCHKLASAPELPATQLGEYCYQHMFDNCTSLKEAPELQADTLTPYCYRYMFYRCRSLLNAPKLPATHLASYCYSHMFAGCHSLSQAPELPCLTLASHCYWSMFAGCKSLTTTPRLLASRMFEDCYGYMFYGCTSLTDAPELPATKLVSACYEYMFYGCDSLTKAPKLPATKLAGYCYYKMFEKCAKLSQAPELPATQLVSCCYGYMFYGCTALTDAPELPATKLASACYEYMFKDCTSLDSIKVHFHNWHPSGTSGWLTNVAKKGTFIAPEALKDTCGVSYIPKGWIRINLTSEFNAANVRPNFQDEPEEEEVTSISEQPIDNPEKEESYSLSGQRTTNKQGLIIKNGKLLLVK